MSRGRGIVAVTLAVAALAACSGDTTSTSTTGTVAAQVGASSAMPTVAVTTVPQLLADYRKAGELPALEGTATIWAWRPGTPATSEVAAALAAALGIDGEVTERADGDGYTAGPSERGLWVRADAQGYWTFDGDSTAACATETCTPPSEDEAESVVRDRMAAVGLDPGDYAFTATPQDDGVWVEAALVVDGFVTDVTTTFAIGAGGTVSYGAGQLLAPQPVGESTLIGTDAAFDRLRSDFLWRVYSPVPGSPDDPTGPSSPAAATPTVAAGALPVVTIVSVERDWWTHWADDGTVTLFPAYTFVSDDGDRTTVPAVPDDQLPPELRPTTAAEPGPGG